MMKTEHGDEVRSPFTKQEVIVLILILLITATALIQPKMLRSFEQLAKQDIINERLAFAYNTAKVKGESSEELLRKIADQRILQLEQEGQLEAEIKQRTKEYKNGASDDAGIMYLTHPDAYLYLRYAKEIIEKGEYGESRSDILGRVDPLRRAPDGYVLDTNFFPKLLTLFFRFLRIFIPGITISGASALYPPVSAMALLLLCYLFVRSIAGIRAALLSAIVLSLHPQLFAAFHWGYADTNAINILLSTALLIGTYATITVDSWVKRLSIIAAMILTTFLFSMIWVGSLVFLFLSIGSMMVMLLITVYHHPTLQKYFSWFVGGSIAAVGILIAIFHTHGVFYSIRVYFSSAATQQGMPNPFLFIGEYKILSFVQIISAVGGIWIALLLLMGILSVCSTIRKSPQKHVGLILLLLWIIAMGYPSTRLRFLQFSIIPFSMAVGIGAAWSTTQLNHWLEKKRIPKAIRYYGTISLLIFLILLSTLPKTLHAIENTNPHMNDAIAKIAAAIQKDSTENAIIATWWNEGYIYQYFAERGTYFDGATFDDTLHSYWLSRYFLENDRNIGQNILRSMSCNQHALTAFHMEKIDMNIDMLNALLQQNPSDREEFLREYAKNEKKEEREIKKFQTMMYCGALPPTYIVVSENFLPLMSIFDWYTQTNFDDLEKSIGGRNELNSVAFSCNTIRTKVFCEEGIQADFETKKAKDPLGQTMPFFFYDGKQLYRPQEDVPPNKPVLLLYIDGDRLQGALINSDLLNTIFVRLFFFGGEGMPEYEKIAEASGKYQPRVVAYRVNFEAEI